MSAPSANRSLPLHAKIAIGFGTALLLGMLAHHFVDADAAWLKSLTVYVTQPFARLFLSLIFMLIVPLLFSALVIGVSEMGDMKSLGRIGGRTLVYTVALSGTAVLIGLLLVNVLKPGVGIDPSLRQHLAIAAPEVARVEPVGATVSVLDLLVKVVPENVIGAASSNAGILSVMFFALMFGIGVVMSRESPAITTLKRGIEGLFEVSTSLMNLVIRLAPYAVFCFIFNLVVLFGWDLMIRLGAYVGVVVLGLAIHLFIVYGLALKFVGGHSPIAFFRGVQEAMLMAFSTASSNATLPTSLRVAEERLGLPRQESRFVLTVGATANQNGTALFEGVTVIFLAQFFGIELGMAQQVTLMLVCILFGIGTAGVPSGSAAPVAMICAMVGVPAEGIGLILGVNHFLDMCRTTVNVTGDLCIAVLISGEEGAASTEAA